MWFLSVGVYERQTVLKKNGSLMELKAMIIQLCCTITQYLCWTITIVQVCLGKVMKHNTSHAVQCNMCMLQCVCDGYFCKKYTLCARLKWENSLCATPYVTLCYEGCMEYKELLFCSYLYLLRWGPIHRPNNNNIQTLEPRKIR
jgi:hypothetical protein